MLRGRGVVVALLAGGAESLHRAVGSPRLAAPRAAPSGNLEETVNQLELENGWLRRRLAAAEAQLGSNDAPLWALEDWWSIETPEDARELGKDRLKAALERYNTAHPHRDPLRTDGTVFHLAGELLEVLPSLKQAAATKKHDAEKRRILAAAWRHGHIAMGHVVEGVVSHVRQMGVQVDLSTPFGVYTALLKPDQVTSVTATPLPEFVAECFPRGEPCVAEVVHVDVGKEITAVHLSTKALEESLGEMSIDRDAVYARGRARMATQPPPHSRAERRKLDKASLDAMTTPGYLSALEEFGDAAFERARRA